MVFIRRLFVIYLWMAVVALVIDFLDSVVIDQEAMLRGYTFLFSLYAAVVILVYLLLYDFAPKEIVTRYVVLAVGGLAILVWCFLAQGTEGEGMGRWIARISLIQIVAGYIGIVCLNQLTKRDYRSE